MTSFRKQARHILDNNESRTKIINEAFELCKQKSRLLTFTSIGIDFAPELARGTAHKYQTVVVSSQTDFLHESLWTQFRHIVPQEFCRLVVFLVRMAARFIVVDAC